RCTSSGTSSSAHRPRMGRSSGPCSSSSAEDAPGPPKEARSALHLELLPLEEVEEQDDDQDQDDQSAAVEHESSPFSSWCRLRRCSERLVEAPAGSVVARELGPVRLVAVPALVELGSALDLVLRPADVDLLVVTVDAIDHARRDHDLLAEDPRARIDDDVARANVVGRLVDLADRPVDRLDAEPSQILPRQLVSVCPEVRLPHSGRHLPSSLSLAGTAYPGFRAANEGRRA